MYFNNKSITVIAALYIANNGLVLASEAKGLPGLKATHLLRSGLTVPFGKKEESMKQNVKRVLERANKNIFSRVYEDDDCCCCSEEEDPLITSSSPTVTPSHTPTASPSYSEKTFLASDGESEDFFGFSCSMTDDLVVIGAPYDDDYEGAAYLFKLDGTEVIKLEAGDDLDDDDYFGHAVSIDEKVVVGTEDENYVRVFSRDGTYDRTLRCDDCQYFGKAVATHGNKIVTKEHHKLYIYTTEGVLLKEEDFGGGSSMLYDVAISDEIIACITGAKTVLYSNSAPDFPLIVEIEKGGYSVEVSGDKLVIGTRFSGFAWLYNVDGTLVKELEHNTTEFSYFGRSVAITNDKVLVGARRDDVGGDDTGSVFIYSAIDGEFLEKVLASDAQDYDYFGASVCSNGSYYTVGAPGDDDYTGAAYLFNLPL